MTAQTQRYDAQRALDRPAMTLAEAGRRAERINSALADLFDVAERCVGRGLGDGPLREAVRAVKEARRG